VGAVLLLATLASCSGETAGGNPAAVPDGSDGGAGASAALSFPTGPAVLVPVGYEPPDDRVDSTGAYLPVNGKPTLVYVDTIW
jgi:hypothetical protein